MYDNDVQDDEDNIEEKSNSSYVSPKNDIMEDI